MYVFIREKKIDVYWNIKHSQRVKIRTLPLQINEMTLEFDVNITIVLTLCTVYLV